MRYISCGRICPRLAVCLSGRYIALTNLTRLRFVDIPSR